MSIVGLLEKVEKVNTEVSELTRNKNNNILIHGLVQQVGGIVN